MNKEITAFYEENRIVSGFSHVYCCCVVRKFEVGQGREWCCQSRFVASCLLYSSLVTPSTPTALEPSISLWHCLSISVLIRCPMDVNTKSGCLADNSDILASSVGIVPLPLSVDYVSLLIWPYMTAFPPEALPSFIGTMQSSDCLFPVCFTSSSVVRHTTYTLLPYGWYGGDRLSPVDAKSLYDMADHRPRSAE